MRAPLTHTKSAPSNSTCSSVRSQEQHCEMWMYSLQLSDDAKQAMLRADYLGRYKNKAQVRNAAVIRYFFCYLIIWGKSPLFFSGFNCQHCDSMWGLAYLDHVSPFKIGDQVVHFAFEVVRSNHALTAHSNIHPQIQKQTQTRKQSSKEGGVGGEVSCLGVTVRHLSSRSDSIFTTKNFRGS